MTDRVVPNEVRVWIARASDARLTPLLDVLSPDERSRAARFRRPEDARAFSVARALARVAVARALGPAGGPDPRALAFALGPYGKPHLQRRAGDPDVRFNVSHSGDVVALALTLDHDVGVDVEERRPLADMAEIAALSFSPRERAEVLARPLASPSGSPDDERHRAFFACWSRKEAVIKALGFGLAFPLEAFDVEVEPHAPAPIAVTSRDARLDPGAWALSSIVVGDLTRTHGSALFAPRAASIRTGEWPVP